MKKSIFIVSAIVVLIISLLVNVSAENLAELSTNDLFIKYPYYLNNAETNDIIKNATDTYNDVMSDYDENDEFISALKSGVSSSVEVIIRDLGSKLGLMDSYYETCMDTATIELMQTLYADENLIAGLDVVKKSSELLENVKTVSEITAVKSCEIAGHLENLSESQVLAMTEELVENSGEILESVEDAVNIPKYIYIACIITDVELEMIDILMERVDKNGEIYEGLSRLRRNMSYDIVGYTSLTFVKNKGLAHISEAVTKLGLSSLGISTGPFLIGQILAKTAVWVMFDVIYPHPGADEVISNMIHSMYVMELETALINQRLAFNSPFYVSDMEAYETFFTVYLAAVKTTLDSTKVLAKNEAVKQNLENAKQNLECVLPNYEAYINKCKNEVLNTSEADRIMRTKDKWQYTTVKTTVNEEEDIDNCKIIPLTDEGEIYWKVGVSSELIIDREVSVPELRVTRAGTLNIQNKIIVNGKVEVEGILKMETDDAHMVVFGEYRQFYSGDGKSDYITAGTLELKSSMYGSGYTPRGTHKTVISGTALQSIHMHYSGRSGYFNILELKMAEAYFPDATGVRKELYSEGGKITRPENIYLTGTATIRGNVYNDAITLAQWTATESNTFNGIVYTWVGAIFAVPQTVNGKCEKTTITCYGNEGTSIFNGEYSGRLSAIGGEISAEFNSQVILYGGGIRDSTVIINGLLYNWDDYGGSLALENGRLIVNAFVNSSILKMEHPDDYILIKNNFWYTSDATSKYIVDGIIEVKGNINSAYGYNPEGNHKTILSGDKKQTVDLDYTYSSKIGMFNNLEIANTSKDGVYLNGEKLNIKGELIQSTGCPIICYSSDSVILQNKPAFVDYGELNTEINRFNGNAENVIPTWLDYERYCKIAFDRDKVIIINESITDTAFTCDLYFSNDYDKTSAIVIIAFYDVDNRFVQMASKPVDVKVGKIDVSIDYANKPYSTYKIMVWERLGNIKPLMAAK